MKIWLRNMHQMNKFLIMRIRAGMVLMEESMVLKGDQVV